VHDFFQTGALKQILTIYKGGVSYPIAGRDELVRLMPSLRSRYPSYASFGASRVEDIFPPRELRQATLLEAHTFSSAIALNNGNGMFTLRPLPMEAQFAPVYAILARDFDGDGRMDLLLAGNFYGVPPVIGRYDASYGLLLRGAGDGRFTPVDMEDSNILIEGQSRRMRMLRGAGGASLVAVARNNAPLQMLRASRTPATYSQSPSIALHPVPRIQ
jgi:hypothetical protein